MRALLIVNPAATATSARSAEVLGRELGADLELDATHTRHRGHAESLARQAVTDALDLVVAVGGDGTVNEVVNGLLSDGPSPRLPAFGVLPAGNANVFARALGMPCNVDAANRQLLGAWRAGRRLRVGLGRADSRWFTFCAGFGLDAEVVREVERRRATGTPASTGLFLRVAVRQFLTTRTRRHPSLRLERPGAPPLGPLCLGIVSNTRPWTYLGSRPVVASPQAGLETGLDLLVARRLDVVTTLRTLRRMLDENGRPAAVPSMVGLSDLAEFRLLADEPLAAQVDGEYVGELSALHFRAVPGALSVVC